MKNSCVGLGATIFLAALLTPANPISAQSARSALEIYEEGNVWHMIFVRTGQGMRERYLDNLSQTWQRQVEMAEQLGFVVSHNVLTKWPTNKDDWDVMIIEIFPNMAAYDTFWENWARVDEAILQDPELERNQGTLLNAEREILGIQIAREVLFRPDR